MLGAALIVAGLFLVASRPPVALVQPAPVASVTLSQAPVVSGTTTSPPSLPPPTRDPHAPIPTGYRVQIPRLRIDLPIAEGDVARDIDQQKTPENFAFHLPGSAIPEQGSNTYLYAHARTGMFLTLWNARPGDEIFISTPDLRVLTYVVQDVQSRVPPTDVSWVQPTPSERLTLQTSTGPNAGDPRFVVVAVPAK